MKITYKLPHPKRLEKWINNKKKERAGITGVNIYNVQIKQNQISIQRKQTTNQLKPFIKTILTTSNECLTVKYCIPHAAYIFIAFAIFFSVLAINDSSLDLVSKLNITLFLILSSTLATIVIPIWFTKVSIESELKLKKLLTRPKT